MTTKSELTNRNDKDYYQNIFVKGCTENDLIKAKEALKNGANINGIQLQFYPIIKSAKCGSLEVLKFLIAHNDYEKSDIEAAFSVAVEHNQLKTVQYFLSSKDFKKTLKDHFDDGSPLISACQKGNLDMVKYLLKFPETINTNKYFYNFAPLKSALSNKHLDIVQYLLTNPELNKKFDFNIELNQNLLMLAVKSNQIKIIEFLLNSSKIKNKPNIDGSNVDDDQALVYAARHGNLKMVQFLLTSTTLEKTADIHVDYDKPLIEACVMGEIDIIKYLLTSSELQEHAHIQANKNNPLKTAAKHDNLKVVQYLLTSPQLKEHANVHYLTKDICTNRVWRWVESYKIKKEIKDLHEEVTDKVLNKIKVL